MLEKLNKQTRTNKMDNKQLNNFSRHIILSLQELKGSIKQIRSDVDDIRMLIEEIDETGKIQYPVYTQTGYKQLQFIKDLFEEELTEDDFEDEPWPWGNAYETWPDEDTDSYDTPEAKRREEERQSIKVTGAKLYGTIDMNKFSNPVDK
tara:strand:+ start:127 stop:573 length:447 start_codon:yes stop_codon:yes gene_type:complete